MEISLLKVGSLYYYLKGGIFAASLYATEWKTVLALQPNPYDASQQHNSDFSMRCK